MGQVGILEMEIAPQIRLTKKGGENEIKL